MPFNVQNPNAPRPETPPRPIPDDQDARLAEQYGAPGLDDDFADRYAVLDEDADRADRYADLDADRYANDGDERFDAPTEAPLSAPVAVDRQTPARPAPERTAPSGKSPADQARLDAFLQRIVPLNTIDLKHVLETLGGQVDPDKRSLWTLPNGQRFQRMAYQQFAKDLSDNKGGLTPVQVVARAKGLKQGQAAAWMESQFMDQGVLRPNVPIARPKGEAPPRAAASAPAASRAPATPAVPFAERIAPLAPLALAAVIAELGGSVEEGENNTRTWTFPNGKVIEGWATSQVYRVPQGKGGRGALDLVGYVLDLRAGQAAKWLEDRYMDHGQLKADAPVVQAPPPRPAREARPALTEDERKEAFQARCEPLDRIDIDEVLRALGGQLSKDDKTKFKMENGHNIWHKQHTQIWKDVTADKGGAGGVRLVQHQLGLRGYQAVEWLEQRFTEDGQLRDGVEVTDAVASEDRPVKEYIPPARHKGDAEDAVRRYLLGRQLPLALINAELDRGNLYATVRPDRKVLAKQYPNRSEEELDAMDIREVPQLPHCVFGSDYGAEIRSVDKDGFKGTATGTNPNKAGYRMSPIAAVKEPVMALVEAAVSGMSYRTFFPGRFTYSTNGVSRFDLQMNLILTAMTKWDKYELPQGEEIQFGTRVAFDADIPGDRGAQRIFNAMYLLLMLATPRRNERLAPLLQGRSVTAYLKTLSKDDYETEELAFNEDLWAIKKELFDSGAVSNMPGSSPHELFWGMDLGPRPDLPVHVRPEGPIKDNEDWLPTDQTSGPVIVLNVNRPVLGLAKGPMTIPVNPAAHDYIVHQLNIRRDRPPVENDWNDELKKVPDVARSYDACAAQSFLGADGQTPTVPELPEHMAHFYAPAPRYTSPAKVPPAPATPASRGARFR